MHCACIAWQRLRASLFRNVLPTTIPKRHRRQGGRGQDNDGYVTYGHRQAIRSETDQARIRRGFLRFQEQLLRRKKQELFLGVSVGNGVRGGITLQA